MFIISIYSRERNTKSDLVTFMDKIDKLASQEVTGNHVEECSYRTSKNYCTNYITYHQLQNIRE